MALISAANLLTYADHLGASYDLLKSVCGTRVGGPVAGNVQKLFSLSLALISGVADFEQHADMEAAASKVVPLLAVENVLGIVSDSLTSIQNHCRARGPAVNASITTLDTFLQYYNGGSGGNLFANMVTPSFNKFYQALTGQYLTTGNGGAGATTVGSVMSPGINPLNGNASGMGTFTVGGSFVAGDVIQQNTTVGQLSYSEVNLIAVVTTSFAGGSGAPTITVTGKDHLGNAGQTWTGTFVGNNPTATFSQQTISSGAIAAQARATVTVGTTVGIFPGSLVTINSGLPDQEIVLVEAVTGTTFTAVFLLAHGSSAKVDGNTTLTLVNGSGRRCRQVTNIVLGLTGHNAGVVRVEGAQDRAAV